MYPEFWAQSDTWLHTITVNVTTQRDGRTSDEAILSGILQMQKKIKGIFLKKWTQENTIVLFNSEIKGFVLFCFYYWKENYYIYFLRKFNTIRLKQRTI